MTVALPMLVLLLCLLFGVPIAVALAGSGMFGIWLITGDLSKVLNIVGLVPFSSVADYALTTIPMFILMAYFSASSGLARDLYAAAAAWLSHIRGGLAIATVFACGIFGAMSGASTAAASVMSKIAMPEMRRHGYSGRLATGTLAAGGTLGILIPPSVPLVIYAILAEQNIAKLFAAAMVPGVIAMLGYIAAIAVYVRLVPGQAPELDADRPRFTWRSLGGIAPIAIIFIIVFGGIYGGFFTPTEGAAVGAAATFIAALAKREITWAKFKHCFYATAESSAMIFLIFIGADLMNSALALTQVPAQLASVVNGWGLSPVMVVAAIMLFYVVLGSVMDELSMILLTIPIFFPMIMGLDFGMPKESVAIWFGIMVLMTVGFGMLAPPVGLNVYVVNGMAKDVPIAESYRGVMPFLISDTLRTLLLLFFPAISLWLVKYIS